MTNRNLRQNTVSFGCVQILSKQKIPTAQTIGIYFISVIHNMFDIKVRSTQESRPSKHKFKKKFAHPADFQILQMVGKTRSKISKRNLRIVIYGCILF